MLSVKIFYGIPQLKLNIVTTMCKNNIQNGMKIIVAAKIVQHQRELLKNITNTRTDVRFF